MNALLARILASHKARTALGMYGKSAWTVFKRIGARDARRWLLKDGGDPAAALGRLQDSVSTTSWITRRIITGDVSKYVTQKAVSRTGLDTKWAESSAKSLMDVRKAQVARKTNERILRLKEEEFIKRQYPSLDLITGEIRQRSNLNMQVRDIARWTQLAALAPGTGSQVFANQVVQGAGMQLAATALMNMITAYEGLSGPAWATPFMNNLDEVALGSGSVRDMFGAVELGIQAFNMLTVVKTGGVFRGNYHRVNRMAFFANLGLAAKQRSFNPLRQYGSVAGAGRLTGALGARQVALLTGQDDRNRAAYIKRERNRKSTGKMITIEVSPYTRRDGTKVSGHTRTVEAYYA